ncbi:MAG TPA: class I SAM-dependent methyltransferase [Burkholderiales bacterium]|nr:class I SAM-dependent methyltransferase [Burkholderiales bacterium]
MVTVAIGMLSFLEHKCALDLGCGDGKNASALATAGFRVVAIDKSRIAIENAMRSYGTAKISWLVADLSSIEGPPDAYDLVLATGSLHCLPSVDAVNRAVSVMQSLTKKGGVNVLSSFNDGPQDLRGHDVGFTPVLLSHTRYMEMYARWDILQSSNSVETDIHPHNEIEHSHSITRILAKRPQ